MTRKYFRALIWTLLILVVFVGIHLKSVFDKVYGEKVAYLYHPASDEIYGLTLRVPINEYALSELIFDPSYIFNLEPDNEKYLGRLSEILDEIDDENALIASDTDAWMESMRVKMELEKQQLENQLETGSFDFEVFDLMLYRNSNIASASDIPAAFDKVFSDVTFTESELSAVDAVITKVGIGTNVKPISSSIYANSILIEGAYAKALDEYGLYDYRADN